MNKAETNIQIILIVTKHPVFGHMLVPYTAKRTGEATLQILEQASHAHIDAPGEIGETGVKVTKIASAYTDKNLMQVYSKEKRVADFLKKVSQEVIQKHIRPFIEIKTQQLIELARINQIMIYQNEPGNKILFEHNAYNISPYKTEIHFHFTADDTNFSYSLTCYQNGEAISLREKKPVITLTQYPASICIGSDLLVFREIEANRIIPFTNKKNVSVDVSQTDKYLEKIVLPVIRNHQVTSSGLNIFQEELDLRPTAMLENDFFGEPVLLLGFNYGKYSFYPGQPGEKMAWMTEENGKKVIRYFYRDLAGEQEWVSKLQDSGLSQIDEKHFRLSNTSTEKSLIDWIKSHRELLTKEIHLTNQKDGADYYLDEIAVESEVTETPDWFDIYITVIIGKFRIPFICFRKHILNRQREYLLPDGKIALLPENWFDTYSDLIEYNKENNHADESIRVEKSYAGIVNYVFTNTENKQPLSYRPKNLVQPPGSLKATLRPYQLDGFNWMVHLYENGYGGCLADDMGLGKTLQTLTLLQFIHRGQDKKAEDVMYIQPAGTDESGNFKLFDELTEKNTIDPVKNLSPATTDGTRKTASLIVMPTSLIHNWRKEISRFTTLSQYEFTGNNATKDVNKIFDRYHLILVSYGIMRNHIDLFRNYTFEYIVLDESQYIKNSDSITFKAAVQLEGNRKMVLTGTPIENSLKDLWSQFHFIQPGLLGSESEFNKKFVTPLKQKDVRVEKRLRAIIEPFFLRRKKEQVAPELPPLIEETIYCRMTSGQKELYEFEKNSVRRFLLDSSLSQKYRGDKLNVLNSLLKLRQLAMHPLLIDREFTGESGKLENIISAYETIRSEDHKVLIFSSFVEHLKIIGKAFDERGWQFSTLTGATTNRENEIKRFSTDKQMGAFLISIKAGGTGLNLIEADYVFIVDPWWNPAVEMQAVSRAHRIGQSKPVFSYRFITQDSIEEKILILQDEKKKLADTFINENDPFLSLNDEEWENLLT